MKIAEIVCTFPPYHGGMGNVCYYNASELAKRGHNVTVFTMDHGTKNYENDPKHFSIVRLKSPWVMGDGGLLPQLCTCLKGFDVVHLHYPFFGGAEYAWLHSLLFKTKYFVTYHMDVYGDTPFKKLVIGGYEPIFLSRIINRAQFIISPGIHFLKESKAARCINYNKVIQVQIGGVDIDIFKPAEKRVDLIQKHNLEQKRVALFVGNFKPFKGLNLLIEAIKKIKDTSVILLIVGGGYAEREYKNLVQEYRLENRAIFVGPQTAEGDLPAYFNLADFLVLPSIHSESFGLVVLEAMASGKPAIVSSLPGPSQLINHGEDGFLVEVGEITPLQEKIEYLARNPALCKKMGDAARKKVVARNTWRKIAEEIDKGIQEKF